MDSWPSRGASAGGVDLAPLEVAELGAHNVVNSLPVKATGGRLLGPRNEVRTVTQEPTGSAAQHEQVSRLFQTLQSVDAEVVER